MILYIHFAAVSYDFVTYSCKICLHMQISQLAICLKRIAGVRVQMEMFDQQVSKGGTVLQSFLQEKSCTFSFLLNKEVLTQASQMQTIMEICSM